MKTNRYFALFALAICMLPLNAAVVTTDPMLTATVAVQTDELKKKYDERSKKQKAIEAAQMGITVSLDALHRVEKESLEYMKNASAAVQNLSQIMQCTELVTVSIPSRMAGLLEAVKECPKGAAITAVASRAVTKCGTEIIELYDFMNELVTSTSYSFSDKTSSTKKKHVNLLNAAERYYIATTVLEKLRDINWHLLLITYQVKTFNWYTLWRAIDFDSYAYYQHGRLLSQQIITDWNRLSKR